MSNKEKKAVSSKKKDDLALEDKIQELTADLQRVHADFVNYRRRSEEEQGQVMGVAKQLVVTQLLPVFDNLDRVQQHTPKDLKGNAWVDGVIQAVNQVESSLKQLGVEKIQAKGQPFDPTLHEAMSAEGEGDKEIVIEELQPGYKMGDQILRPAMVKVGRTK